MKIATAQLDAGVTHLDRRRSEIASAVTEAASLGCSLVVLPELALSGYGAGTLISKNAQELSGADVTWLKALSAQTGCGIVCGLALKREGQVYNTALFTAPDGTVIAYDKIHLYGDYEQTLFKRGAASPPVFTFGGLTFGLLVCFDVEFPERVRGLALRGADAVLVPTALPKSDGGAFIAQSVIPVRAFENQVFIAYANHCGKDAMFCYQGQSSIAAPDGQRLAQAPATDPALLAAELDPGAYAACRQQNPYLEEVRLCFDRSA
ncbi:carbon-nitrogen hydrolase family protein [Roseibium denhamense]|uniref:Predicted amidohydrolase n=1 Tax=Roseibium denhamense TaxID=76305 RepID=A0ABY1PHH3_9HYPH|nr:carbon-nitrogen hydrolase family protein [Roseibium denhamense]MTI05596.1 carbon-nitrogen hydrolase family protein [Roseibium denhamense]SMP34533.1 Predicted amidohydrolase [Roseibium denhamense]